MHAAGGFWRGEGQVGLDLQAFSECLDEGRAFEVSLELGNFHCAGAIGIARVGIGPC